MYMSKSLEPKLLSVLNNAVFPVKADDIYNLHPVYLDHEVLDQEYSMNYQHLRVANHWEMNFYNFHIAYSHLRALVAELSH